MKKQWMAAVLAGLLLAGCAQEPPKETETQPTIVETEAPEVPETTAAPILHAPDARHMAYQQLLETFVSTCTLPEVEFERMEGFGEMSLNQFALADVDGDGEDELIIRYTTAPTAGMCEWVYGFDGEQVYLELTAFPNITYYTGGLAEAGWSHNQGMAGYEFWPYTLLGYDPSTRSYTAIATVDGWNGTLYPTDYEGTPFPKELDTDGSGMLYLVSQGEETQTLSQTQYNDWHAALFGSAAPINIPYQYLTPETIREINPTE